MWQCTGAPSGGATGPTHRSSPGGGETGGGRGGPGIRWETYVLTTRNPVKHSRLYGLVASSGDADAHPLSLRNP